MTKGETPHLESIYGHEVAVHDELKESLLHQGFSGELSGGSARQEVAR